MGAILIKNLTKTYGDRKVLDHLSMVIQDGVTTCIMAPSGAGKTTLLRILMGLEQPDSGTVTGITGQKQSVVFQEERLCEYLSASDNIRLVNPAVTVQHAILELGKLGLTDSACQPVSELSGGMRRRVSILRALLADYDVLFLDEPFQGLDHGRKRQVMTYVRENTKGKTTVLVTHDQTEAEWMGAVLCTLDSSTANR